VGVAAQGVCPEVLDRDLEDLGRVFQEFSRACRAAVVHFELADPTARQE
jgi:hypothetical protein